MSSAPSRQVLVFRHLPSEHLGRIAEPLEIARIPFQYQDLYLNPASHVSLENAAGLIFLGGPMSANDNLDFIRRELDILEAGIRAGLPVLGVCLGAQLIARTLGERVYPNRVKEIGWAPVFWTSDACGDRLFSGLETPETVFHWHGETFDLPAGAEWLAWSAACRNQAFRYGAKVWGLQFHLEVTAEMISEWCRQDAQCGDRRELTTPLDPNAHAGRLDQLAGLVFGRWAELLP